MNSYPFMMRKSAKLKFWI